MTLTLTQIQTILEKENLLREFITPAKWCLTAPFEKTFSNCPTIPVKWMRTLYSSVKEIISSRITWSKH